MVHAVLEQSLALATITSIVGLFVGWFAWTFAQADHRYSVSEFDLKGQQKLEKKISICNELADVGFWMLFGGLYGLAVVIIWKMIKKITSPLFQHAKA
jgi:hypothetical protein